MVRQWGLITALTVLACWTVVAAARSELLAWRQPIYIAASFAGILGLLAIIVQPLLVGQKIPGLAAQQAKTAHLAVGVFLVVAVICHVGGLWLTSPPDVLDALLLRAPTSFSLWGVIAMWLVFTTALLAGLRQNRRVSPRFWRVFHSVAALLIVVGTIAHVMLIDGLLAWPLKLILGMSAGGLTLWIMAGRKPWRVIWR